VKPDAPWIPEMERSPELEELDELEELESDEVDAEYLVLKPYPPVKRE
jgi:hypothetical protein